MTKAEREMKNGLRELYFFDTDDISNLLVMDVRGKGRCVFARRAFRKNETITYNHVIIADNTRVKGEPFDNYKFEWDPEDDGQYTDFIAIPIGLMALVNHFDEPNAHWECLYDVDMMSMVANRDIEAGEEITFDYGYDPDKIKVLPPAKVEMEPARNHEA